MRFLILGGTQFLSSAVAAESLRRGHEVTCLARGVSGAVPPGARLIRADRSMGAAAYSGARGDWDAVVDVTWEPSFARDALGALADRTGHWTYVSSCSVYADQGAGRVDEDAGVVQPLYQDAPASIESYAQSKVACEELCSAAFPSRLHICRPGLIGGPEDRSDRFGYWPARFARNREDDVLVPADLDASTQVIDVRDLAAWIVSAAESGIDGTMNAVGETHPLGFVLAAAQVVAGHRGSLVPVDEDWLLEHGVTGWSGPESLPLWIPRVEGLEIFARRSGQRARHKGLVTRPIDETLEATLNFELRAGVWRDRRAGLSPANERCLLSEWLARPN